MKTITVDEDYQTGYTYQLEEQVGKNFDPEFQPELSPTEMLGLGIFGGDYFTRVPKEFPAEWFKNATFSNSGMADKDLNFFKVNASQPLKEWQRKGWINEEDPKGWFLWYCRYYQGRRILEEDQRQIKRWKNMRRHVAQIEKNCKTGDFGCHTKQRQALLHWAYDSRKL
jgi:hypothetical protein